MNYALSIFSFLNYFFYGFFGFLILGKLWAVLRHFRWFSLIRRWSKGHREAVFTQVYQRGAATPSTDRD